MPLQGEGPGDKPPLRALRLATWTYQEQHWLKFPPLLLGIWGKQLKISVVPLPAAQKPQAASYRHRVLLYLTGEDGLEG